MISELTYNQFIQLNHIKNLSDRQKMLYYNMYLNQLTILRLNQINEQNIITTYSIGGAKNLEDIENPNGGDGGGGGGGNELPTEPE